ncbi:DUF1963 domain-containing protein [Amycolatopsis sp. NPDC058340]|uniref:DUF1963 domain-containing protein n=1 Tax=Amycolatopsis sp. NPDC058340 TaxID=3346453 RepID=UPI0036517E33
MSSTAIPTDNGRQIPGLAGLARTAVRLHPRPGAPTVRDSHLGGPLLWPADEPWPHCGQPHPSKDQGPLLAVAQFFGRDLPNLPFPDGTDLLQVLWCPCEHDATHAFGPAVRLVWRRAGDVNEVLDEPPHPTAAEGEFSPKPCVLNPCEVVDYPDVREIPDEIKSTLSFVDEDGFFDEDSDAYNSWPTVTLGSKLGGWAYFWQSDPWQLDCHDCGTPLRLLLSFHTHESQDDRCSCPQPQRNPVGWRFGRDGALNVFACTQDVTHTVKPHID